MMIRGTLTEKIYDRMWKYRKAWRPRDGSGKTKFSRGKSKGESWTKRRAGGYVIMRIPFCVAFGFVAAFLFLAVQLKGVIVEYDAIKTVSTMEEYDIYYNLHFSESLITPNWIPIHMGVHGTNQIVSTVVAEGDIGFFKLTYEYRLKGTNNAEEN